MCMGQFPSPEFMLKNDEDSIIHQFTNVKAAGTHMYCKQ